MQNQTKTPEEVAAKNLAAILIAEIKSDIPKETLDVFKDLLFISFKEVDWNCIAEELMTV